jgi:Family of unknown function (DUF6152)
LQSMSVNRTGLRRSTRFLFLLKSILCPAMILLAPMAWAHHSTTAVFDVSKKLTLSGTLTKVDWVNPHIVVLIDADAKSGVENWRFESNPPSWFRRVGASRQDFVKAVNQKVKVEAFPAKDGTMYGYLVKITFLDGTSLELVSPEVAAEATSAATSK